LILVVLMEIADTRLGWPIDLAWLLVCASAFAWPVGVAPIAGLLFGLTLDGLSGSGVLIYAVSYGGFGLIILLMRKAFFLKGFIPGWIIAIAGAELLWLFMWVFALGIHLLGGASRSPGWLSPSLLSTAILYPVVYLGASRLLSRPAEPARKTYYSEPSKVIRI
jgi:cell shape-determining protein MreD